MEENWRDDFGGLNGHLMSDFDEFGMGRLVSEWDFGFCDFCQISRRGPGAGFEPILGFDYNLVFFLCNWFL